MNQNSHQTEMVFFLLAEKPICQKLNFLLACNPPALILLQLGESRDFHAFFFCFRYYSWPWWKQIKWNEWEGKITHHLSPVGIFHFHLAGAGYGWIFISSCVL